MKKQGIITGIGNTITPEIDAILNDFIVGENAIIKGLDWVGNVLNAGMCQLRGYRGVLEQTITTTDKYVYGVFVLHFNEQREDEFYIETSSTAKTTNVNPTSITSAGTYYLELYNDKKTTLPTYKYPKQAQTSDRARDLIAGGTIDSTATTPTAPINDNSKRVANTEYVHKQIEKEIAYEKVEGDVFEKTNTSQKIGTFILEKKSKFVILKLNINVRYGTPAKFIPNNFLPREDFYALIQTGGAYCNIYKITTSGEFIERYTASDGRLPSDVQYTTCIGYECK